MILVPASWWYPASTCVSAPSSSRLRTTATCGSCAAGRRSLASETSRRPNRRGGRRPSPRAPRTSQTPNSSRTRSWRRRPRRWTPENLCRAEQDTRARLLSKNMGFAFCVSCSPWPNISQCQSFKISEWIIEFI